MTDLIRGAPSPDHPESWIVRRKGTGEVVAELFDSRAVGKLNTAKYEAVPIVTYLQSINGHAQ